MFTHNYNRPVGWQRRGSCQLIAAWILAGISGCAPDTSHTGGADSGGIVDGTPCTVLDSPRQASAAEELTEIESLCNVVAHKVIQLEPDESGIWPDPGLGPIAQDGAGQLYTGTASASGVAILAWSKEGEFVRTLGRQGNGPGEFPVGAVFPYVTRGDSLLVLSRGRLTVFGPSGALVRTVSRPPLSRYPATATCLLNDGRFVSVGPLVGSYPDRRFHITTTAGTLDRSFGDVSNHTVALDRLTPQAACAADGFWAVAEAGLESAYVLEHWSAEGAIISRIRRDAEWWRHLREDREKNFLQPVQLHADSRGLIWIVLAVRRAPGAGGEESIGRDQPVLEPLRLRYEVIDPVARMVVAHGELPDIDMESSPTLPPFTHFIPHTNRGVGFHHDRTTGLITAEIFELHLQS